MTLFSYVVSITSPLNLYYFCCTDEDIEAQKGERASPTSQRGGPVTTPLNTNFCPQDLLPTSRFACSRVHSGI